MSEILVNTIKKADGTGSLTVPAETGTVLTSTSGAQLSGADFTGQVKVQTASASGQTPSTDADEFVLENNGNAGMTLVTSDGGTGSIRFNSATGSDYASIRVNYGDNELRLSQNNSSGFVRIDTNGSERMRMKSDGRCIWSTDGSITSQVADGRFTMKGPFSNNRGLVMQSSNSAGGDALYFCIAPSASSVGRIAITSSGTTYHTSSDYRLKENVTDLTGAITRVKQLQPRQFNFISDPDDTVVDGFVAHEVSSVCPEAIYGEYDGTRTYINDEGVEVTEDDYQGMDYGRITPLLTAALKEALAKIETLETTVSDLQTRVTALEGA